MTPQRRIGEVPAHTVSKRFGGTIGFRSTRAGNERDRLAFDLWKGRGIEAQSYEPHSLVYRSRAAGAFLKRNRPHRLLHLAPRPEWV